VGLRGDSVVRSRFAQIWVTADVLGFLARVGLSATLVEDVEEVQLVKNLAR
jgi:hypothetical protein